MRLCTNCETMVEDSRAKICPNCGAVLPPYLGPTLSSQPPSPVLQMNRSPQPPSSGNQVARALLIAVLIIVGLGALLFLGLLVLCGVIGVGGGVH
jgi:hypothetical protein